VKVITETATKVAKYLLDDNVTVTLESNRIVLGNLSDRDEYIADLNSGNATLHTGATGPVDGDGNSTWYGCKYTFDGTTWAEVSGWVQPTPPEESE
jgi:uncharacterized membrane protein YvbJ